MTPAQKRALFPLRAPRWQSQAWTPWHVLSAAVNGYHEAFFMVMTPERRK